MHKITEVDGEKYADDIQRFNALFPDDFLPLKPMHFAKGFWWLVHDDIKLIGFAGMVPFAPFPCVGYLKRMAVLKEHRGHGLQRELMEAREGRARSSTAWTHIVSECSVENIASGNNFISAGYRLCEPERPWEKDTIFWIKKL
jgi:GNAT superfamily N-acetyltransferase